MRLRWLVWTMNILFVPAALVTLAVLIGAWEALRGDGASWGVVGQLALLATALIVPGLCVDRLGRSRGNGQTSWWLDDQLALDDLRWKKPDVAAFGAFTTTALMQTATSLSPETDVSATDELLHDYWAVEGIDWRSVWQSASEGGTGVPVYGSQPYWGRKGDHNRLVALSVLAFCERDLRLEFAASSKEDRAMRQLLASDPSPEVSRAARS